jgi:flagellar biosynthesis GTPase FlhF
MNSTCRTAIAAAVAGGYVLGRTRKAKMAFAIGTLLAGRRFGLNPASLAAEGVRQLRETPHLAGLREQIGGDLVEAARAAASASADRRFSAFADTLRERGREDTGGEELEDEDYEDEEEEPEEESSERRQAPARERKKAPAKKAAAKKTGPAKKAAARGKAAPAKKAAGKKTAPSRSRSTTSRRGR